MALDLFYDKVTVEPILNKEIEIQLVGIGADSIPTEPERNSAGLVAQKFLTRVNWPHGLRIKLEKGIIPGYGLGSSGASAAATAVALNKLLKLHLPNVELIKLAAYGEIAAAGTPHLDNVSAAILGNFVVIGSHEPLDVIHLEPPKFLEVCIAIPRVPVPPRKTEVARKVIPEMVSLRQAVRNVGRASALVAGFALKDIDLIGRAMEDAIIEPVRASLVPGYQIVRKKAIEAGASGVAISGAGPSLIAIVNSQKVSSKRVAEAMVQGFEEIGVKADGYVAKPSKGASLVGDEA
jgi:homoserine kinase